MEAPFLSDARVDGIYTPSLTELPAILQKFDLEKEFENTKLIKDGAPGLTLSFDSLRQSHLFALAIYVKGAEMQLWVMGPSDEFFNGKPIDDNRYDGILSFSETLKDEKSIAHI